MGDGGGDFFAKKSRPSWIGLTVNTNLYSYIPIYLYCIFLYYIILYYIISYYIPDFGDSTVIMLSHRHLPCRWCKLSFGPSYGSGELSVPYLNKELCWINICSEKVATLQKYLLWKSSSFVDIFILNNFLPQKVAVPTK